MLSEGAAIIDIGGVSTRPGAVVADEEEEVRRLRVALSAVRSVHKDIMLSVDTFRPAVARMAVEEFGVEIINDVSEGGAAANGGIMAEAARSYRFRWKQLKEGRIERVEECVKGSGEYGVESGLFPLKTYGKTYENDSFNPDYSKLK
jgi:dihydropteroate synthase